MMKFRAPHWRLSCIVFVPILLVASLLAGHEVLAQAPHETQNSTKKLRVKPSPQSLRVGSAVQWRTDFERAKAESAESGKPIFWYIPTVTGTFMDRKTEVDRYMLAGPFSWPGIISLLNDRFIPLRSVPRRSESTLYGLQVYKFIEPGFIVLDREANKLLVGDRLTTTDPRWFFEAIASTLNDAPTWVQSADPINAIGIETLLDKLDLDAQPVSDDELVQLRTSPIIEHQMVAAMLLHRQGNQKRAQAEWQAISERFTDHPLGWKAACEAQRIGPYERGFEIFDRNIRAALPSSPDTSFTSSASTGTYDEQQLWERGCKFLLAMQDETGGYFDSDYDFGGTDSLPNVYVAVTSLVGLALLEAKRLNVSPVDRTSLDRALAKTIDFVSDEKNLNSVDQDEILWAEAYRVILLARCKAAGVTSASSEKLQDAVNQLQSLQAASGTWFHEYENAFVTATALVALHEAKLAGAEVDREKVDRGLARLDDQRMQNGAYPYSTRQSGVNDAGNDRDLAGSGGRISICELARFRWQAIPANQLSEGVRRSLQFHDLLAKALKYDNHTSTLAYGGFFFWYDMQARSEAISMLEPGADRDDMARRQREIVIGLPEIDGCFVDSHELGRCYGTAMALLSLSAL